jgi:hypothetical protein
MAGLSVVLFLFLILFVSVLWLVWHRAGASERRMRRMMQHHGLEPEIAAQGNYEVVIREVRRRCKKCQFGGHCESWLAGREGGDSSFCPNAQVFEDLVRTVYA